MIESNAGIGLVGKGGRREGGERNQSLNEKHEAHKRSDFMSHFKHNEKGEKKNKKKLKHAVYYILQLMGRRLVGGMAWTETHGSFTARKAMGLVWAVLLVGQDGRAGTTRYPCPSRFGHG
jgi:hypothetical protein